MDLLMIFTGLVLLFLGGEALVRGSVTISNRLKISKVLIGVVIVGFGTSTPELLVSIKASLMNQPDIALGNVVGSNIANILLILGLSAVITPVICKNKTIYRDAIVVVVSSILLFGLSYQQIILPLVGALMFTSLTLYLSYSYLAEMKEKKSLTSKDQTLHGHESDSFINNLSMGSSIIITLFGIVMLTFGAEFLVKGASNIAREMGVSEAIIGLSLVAFGTSLPEIATAISASIKKDSDVIIGNVLGSNLFNVLSILGITAMIKPIPITGQIANFDIPLSLAIAIILLIIILVFKNITRLTGLIFLVAYTSYIIYLLIY